MNQASAEIKAKVYNAFVKHPELNYRPIRTGHSEENKFGVGQFLGERLVGIAYS